MTYRYVRSEWNKHLPDSFDSVYLHAKKLMWIDYGQFQGMNPSISKTDLIVLKAFLDQCLLDPKWEEQDE